ncbi:hypothetical protein DB32_007830 [Sandaracinus amylolyticus]|uniref:Uncharacterized protein n=1 Tax=Sandaracinus amylolyticus TaxID=927083 RepID=A0A0F6W974_9BACT|nr:hypothetical protein DB32_007830 [Sandaracinus amylolyticus]
MRARLASRSCRAVCSRSPGVARSALGTEKRGLVAVLRCPHFRLTNRGAGC